MDEVVADVDPTRGRPSDGYQVISRTEDLVVVQRRSGGHRGEAVREP